MKNDFKQSWEKLWKKNQTWGENYFLGKIMLEIIFNQNKSCFHWKWQFTNEKSYIFHQKCKKIILSWPAPLARWSYQSLGQAQNFPSEIAPVVKHEMKIKNKTWLFLIWEIIKKITHYYFNKKSLSVERKMERRYKEQLP